MKQIKELNGKYDDCLADGKIQFSEGDIDIPLAKSLLETSKEEYKNLWTTIIAGKEWRGEFHNIKKNGELYWESAIISPIKNEKGEITHYLAVKEDITGFKILQQQFLQALQK